MELSQKRKMVIDFYNIYIEGFIIGDLKILQSIKPDPNNGLNGCTIPTAMTVISCIELLGFLLNKGGETGKSEKNLSYFFNFDSGSLLPDYYLSQNILDKILNYRHGMMHHFFPKFKGQYAGICKNDQDSSLFILHLIDGVEQESLNVSVLTTDLIIAFEKLKVFFQNCIDESLFDTIIKGLKDIEYYIPKSSSNKFCTTINPGTPKNK